MQTDVAVEGKKISGTLHFIEGGLAASGPLAGDGYFLALKFSDTDEAATSVLVGLQPSQGTGLVEIINDPDQNGVFKIKDTKQKFVVVDSNDEKKTKTVYDLSGLILEEVGV